MNRDPYSFSVKDKKVVARDTWEITLDTQHTPFSFIPGQYIRMTIPEISKEVDGGNSRSFTLSSSPTHTTTITITTRASGSPFKKALLKIPLGENILVRGPFGEFILPENPKEPVTLIAGGIGITPFLSMIRFELEKKSKRPMALIYANSSQDRAAYLNELLQASSDTSHFTFYPYYRRIDEAIIKKLPFERHTMYYLCGPPMFVAQMKKNLFDVRKIDPDRVLTEDFDGYIGLEN